MNTLGSLIALYKSDQDSPYQAIRHCTRLNYDSLLRRLDADHGSELLSDIRARNFRRWHEAWTEASGAPHAHSLVSMLRSLFAFGRTIMDEEDEATGGHCARLGLVLHDLRFAMPPARRAALTAEQASAIRAAAHARGLHSLALAQAFQFDLLLRQKDVIGEYEPERWCRGLRWEEIDANLVLRHTTSKKLKDIEFSLRSAPMVMEELTHVQRQASGPVIIREATGEPWCNSEYRKTWRKLARECGIPDDVQNRDSRAGGITEASDAGADLEHVRHAATHSDIATTQRYSRNTNHKVAQVMELRAAYRQRNAA